MSKKWLVLMMVMVMATTLLTGCLSSDKKPEAKPDPAKFLPGDIVTCTVPPHLPHVMIVSDRKTAAGTPLVIHNIGAGAREEDCLLTYPLTGHYRWK